VIDVIRYLLCRYQYYKSITRGFQSISLTGNKHLDIADQYGGYFTFISADDSINRKGRIVLMYKLKGCPNFWSKEKEQNNFKVEELFDRFTGNRNKSRKFQQVCNRDGDGRQKKGKYILDWIKTEEETFTNIAVK
jgi:hypothetical protein